MVTGEEKISESEREALYRVIKLRRDVRHFSSKPLPEEALLRILQAAHNAPSVGFMQPWNFIIVTSPETREEIKRLFEATNQVELAKLNDFERKDLYRRLKLEGILEAPLNIAVTCDRKRDAPFVLGRGSMPEMDLFSTCLAIENMWLASRAEGIGLGWVSLFDRPALEKLLGLPTHIRLVAYLCLGYPLMFRARPMLEELGWKSRLKLEKLVFQDKWEGPTPAFLNPAQTDEPNPVTAVKPVYLPVNFTQREADLNELKGKLTQVLEMIKPLDTGAVEKARARQNQLTKPPGSLGLLEDIALQLAGITGKERPKVFQKGLVVMAADHGVTSEGVSAYPAEVTHQMVLNFLLGGAAINVFARQFGIRLVVADLGVSSDITPHPDLLNYKINYGTRNFSEGPAMTVQEALKAVSAGIEIARRVVAGGVTLLGTGEMGIGNTTASSAILACITGRGAAEVTGRGTGVNEETWTRKVKVIEKALKLNQPDPADPLDILAKVGGFEIGGLAGLILGAAAAGVPVILDGFISTAAALLACKWKPEVKDYLFAAHTSLEKGHSVMLNHLGLAPLLNLNLRLGEGTGAALAMPLVEAAARALDEMATFDEAQVPHILPVPGT